MVTQPQQQDMLALAQEMQKRQQMAQFMRQALPNNGGTTAGQGNANALAQGLQGYLQGMAMKKAMTPQQNIWAPGFDGSAGGWTGQH